MASHKNQHYVPRCYLKPFTLDRNGFAINIYNIDRRKGIPAAPVKGQCSRNYFYGKDLRLETLIQKSEGLYSGTVNRIVEKAPLDDADKVVLRHFTLLQYFRTEAASRRMALAHMEMSDIAFDGNRSADTNPPLGDFVQDGIRAFADAFHIIDDLKVCLVQNRTCRQFITCDDPAILTNRWYLQRSTAKRLSFGLIHSGALLFLPITTQILCVIYDGDVYSLPHDRGWISTCKLTDVDAFNEHQLPGCMSNLFFANWSDLDAVHRAYLEAFPHRPLARHEIVTGVLESETPSGKNYRVVQRETITGQEEIFVHLKSVNPCPSRWPMLIKWREKPRIYSNGTGSGFVRRSQTLRGEGYDRIV